MKTIWKYNIGLGGTCRVSMPWGAVLLAVGMQGLQICVWAMVDSERATILRELAVRGTGHPMPESERVEHVGTVFDPRGFVWHVFDLGEVPGSEGKAGRR